MGKPIILLAMVSVMITGYGQKPASFKTLRYEENYGYLKDDSSSNWYGRLKFSRLSQSGSNYLSIGGEYRYQYLWYRNEDWGDAAADDNGYSRARILLHGDLHITRRFRAFFQLQSSFTVSRTAPGATEKNILEAHQFFIDQTFSFRKDQQLTIRLGRQELLYGSQRLVAVRDGPNSRQSFDAMKILYSGRRIKADLFYSGYVRSRAGILNDRSGKDLRFWGAYITSKAARIGDFDAYYFGLSRKEAMFDDATGKELRHSFGGRISGTLKRFRYDFESACQAGYIGGKRIRAWTTSLNSGFTFRVAELKPSVGLKAELISGDRINDDRKLQTFNPLFPRGNYFGLAALIGPANLADLHPSVSIPVFENTVFSVDYDAFWRLSSYDGIYAPNVALLYSGKNVIGKFIGHQYAADLVFTPNAFIYFRVEFTWFNAGRLLRLVSSGNDIFFAATTIQLKF